MIHESFTREPCASGEFGGLEDLIVSFSTGKKARLIHRRWWLAQREGQDRARRGKKKRRPGKRRGNRKKGVRRFDTWPANKRLVSFQKSPPLFPPLYRFFPAVKASTVLITPRLPGLLCHGRFFAGSSLIRSDLCTTAHFLPDFMALGPGLTFLFINLG